MRNPRLDVIIFAPLAMEFDAANGILREGYNWADPNTGWVYRIGKLDVGPGRLIVGLVESGRGSTETHIAVGAGLDRFKPPIAILFGTAGGRKKTRIGDVLIGTSGRNYEQGKHAPEGFRGMPLSLPSSHRLVQLAKQTARDPVNWHGGADGSGLQPPQVFAGPIVSGDKVLDDPRHDLNRLLQEQHYASVGLEMEAYAFLRTVSSRSETEAINIRGVSDLLSGKSAANEAGSREIALQNAAGFLRAFLLNVERSGKKKPTASYLALGGLFLALASLALYFLPGLAAPPQSAISNTRELPSEEQVVKQAESILPLDTVSILASSSRRKAVSAANGVETPSKEKNNFNGEELSGRTNADPDENLVPLDTFQQLASEAKETSTEIPPEIKIPTPEPNVRYLLRLDIFDADHDQQFYSKVEVNGQQMKTEGGNLLQLPAGEHTIRFYVNNKRVERTITVAAHNKNSWYEEFE